MGAALKKLRKHVKEIAKSGGGTNLSVPLHMMTERTREIVLENTRGLVVSAAMPHSALDLKGKKKYSYFLRRFEGSGQTVDKPSQDYPIQKSKLEEVTVVPLMEQNGVLWEGERAADPEYTEQFDDDMRDQVEYLFQMQDTRLKYGEDEASGFFSMPGINKYTVPAGTGGQTEHDQKTTQECLDDFNHMYSNVLKLIPGIVPNAAFVDTQLLADWNVKEQVDSNGNPYNVRELLEKKYKDITFYEDPSLKDDAGNATFAIAHVAPGHMQVRDTKPFQTLIDDKKTSETFNETYYTNLIGSVAEMKKPWAMCVAQGVSDKAVFSIHERR